MLVFDYFPIFTTTNFFLWLDSSFGMILLSKAIAKFKPLNASLSSYLAR
jgi:hypothetical protein